MEYLLFESGFRTCAFSNKAADAAFGSLGFLSSTCLDRQLPVFSHALYPNHQQQWVKKAATWQARCVTLADVLFNVSLVENGFDGFQLGSRRGIHLFFGVPNVDPRSSPDGKKKIARGAGCATPTTRPCRKRMPALQVGVGRVRICAPWSKVPFLGLGGLGGSSTWEGLTCGHGSNSPPVNLILKVGNLKWVVNSPNPKMGSQNGVAGIAPGCPIFLEGAQLHIPPAGKGCWTQGFSWPWICLLGVS